MTVVFALLLWMMVSGVKVGFNAMVGVAAAGTVTVNNTPPADWEAGARQARVPQERIEEWKAQAKNAPAAAQ